MMLVTMVKATLIDVVPPGPQMYIFPLMTSQEDCPTSDVIIVNKKRQGCCSSWCRPCLFCSCPHPRSVARRTVAQLQCAGPHLIQPCRLYLYPLVKLLTHCEINTSLRPQDTSFSQNLTELSICLSASEIGISRIVPCAKNGRTDQPPAARSVLYSRPVMTRTPFCFSELVGRTVTQIISYRHH
ncbi:unnamed protein product [Trichogramma brassicae]|uniref:Uncharacterized protein n=1 Tax=Trichogramma brassicae TaxID=86971 RepID=A0A6H5HUC2_9HYME|nr:unnamed protein product [Trichogramma brassicae]